MTHRESDLEWQIVYKVYIWVLFRIIFGKEKEALVYLMYN